MHRRPLPALLCAALAATSTAAPAADGSIDTAFGAGGSTYIEPDGTQANEFRTTASTVLPDGRILVAGTRNKIFGNNPDPHMRATLFRLLPDGTPDPAFGNLTGIPGALEFGDLTPGNAQQIIESIALAPDGSVVLAGTGNAFGPLTGFVLRTDVDGNIDPEFGDNGLATVAATYLHGVAIDAEGRIVAAGEHQVPGLDTATVVRLNTDGTRDATFGTNGLATLDTGTNSTYIATLALAADGGILIGGQAATPDFTYDAYVGRLAGNGTPDTAFGTAGLRRFTLPGHGTSGYNGVDNIAVDKHGRIALSAYYSNDDTGINITLGRLQTNGSDDRGFGANGWRDVDLLPAESGSRYTSGLVHQSDGKLVFSVSYSTFGSKTNFLAMRTNEDGSPDTGFGTNGAAMLDLAPSGVSSDSTALTLQGGRPVITGMTTRTSGSNLVDMAAVRLESELIFKDGLGD